MKIFVALPVSPIFQETCITSIYTFANLIFNNNKGTSLELTVEGNSENIRNISKQDLEYFINTHYKASRVVVAARGGVEHRNLLALAEKNFGKLDNSFDGQVPTLPPCRFTGSEVRVRDDSIPLARHCAVEGPGWDHPDKLPMLLASCIVGSWDNSQGTGANHPSQLAAYGAGGLCHNFESLNLNLQGTGLWGIQWVCDPLEIDDFIIAVQQEWKKIAVLALPEDVERAKNLLQTNLLLQLDGNTANCKDIGSQVLRQCRRVHLSELVDKIDSVTPEKMRDVVYKYVYDRCPVVAGVGPVEQLTDYNRIRSSMNWLRL